MCAHGISRSPKTLTSLLNVKEMVALGLKALCIRSEVRLTVGVIMTEKNILWDLESSSLWLESSSSEKLLKFSKTQFIYHYTINTFYIHLTGLRAKKQNNKYESVQPRAWHIERAQ